MEFVVKNGVNEQKKNTKFMTFEEYAVYKCEEFKKNPNEARRFLDSLGLFDKNGMFRTDIMGE